MNFSPDVSKTFNREYTTYFLNGREDCYNFDTPKFVGEYIGTVTEIGDNYIKLNLKKGIKLNNQDGLVFNKIMGCLVNKTEENIIYPNKMPDIKKGAKVYRNSDIKFAKELDTATIKRQIGVSITFKSGEIFATDEDNNTFSLKISESDLPKNPEKMKENFIKSFNKTGESDFYITSIKIDADLPFIPISGINEYRRRLFELLMKERIKNYKRELQKPLKYVDYPDSEIDYRGNVYNKDALEFYKKSGVTVREYAFENSKPKREVELMRTKHCIKYALNMCKTPDKLYLIDDKGQKFNLKFDCKNCEMIICNQN